MKKLIVLGMVLPLCVAPARASEYNASYTTVSDKDSASDDCRDHMQMGDRDERIIVRDEESQTVPNQPLTITGEHNGGIHVTTWDKPEISLKLCKQVAAKSESEGRTLLAGVKLEVNGANVSVHAPDAEHHDQYVGTLLLVKAPKDANLNVSVYNGGVALNGFTGTAVAHARNGGISFKQSSGKLTAEAQNGGVSIKDCGGDVNANVVNGGVSITLPERWEGKGLEVHARNGGLVVAVPKSFNGGLEVTASEHTSIICKDKICDDGQRTSDDRRKTFRMGGANPQVKATSDNGGIVIKERGSSHTE